jgi:hypothetical protein
VIDYSLDDVFGKLDACEAWCGNSYASGNSYSYQAEARHRVAVSTVLDDTSYGLFAS